MSAFTEEQQAVLREVLHHVWSRMGTVHDDQNEDSLRLASAIATLGARGLLTSEEMERIATWIRVDAAVRARQSVGRVLEGEIARDAQFIPWRGRSQAHFTLIVPDWHPEAAC